MKIMIVGGTGFLGYYSAKVALERGYEVGSLSLDDIDLKGWYPEEIKVSYGDVFTMTEEELTDKFKGYDALIYSVGPDDRVTPPAPAYEFFHERLVEHPAKVFTAAKKAGIKRSVVFNSYFATFDRLYPEKGLAVYHPYIKSRVEQAERLIGIGGDGMDVIVLELPYIFGSMPEREPLWKNVFIERFFRYPAIFFPKGGTTMIAVEHIGEAAIGALEHGEHGGRYPIGDENHNFRFMLEAMQKGLGTKKPIMQVSKKICAMGGKMIEKKDAKEGKQAGLDMQRLMLDIMGEELYLPDNDAMSEKLKYGRGGLEEAIIKAMKACYPNGF
ncbi:MAG: NAD(P)H-binding protein [Christensenellaceae bacterium]|nr:NAD(P)H-binding protein [Christensenellaceae bacterium]